MPIKADVTDCPIDGVRIIEPTRFGDARGHFCETYNARELGAIGIDCDFIQDNESWSGDTGTLRGLHYQAPPHAQSKLVRVSRGAVLDVVVDARKGSPTFGQWFSVRLSQEDGWQVFVPRGLLHGFVTLEPDTVVIYKVDDFYSREADGSVAWNDPDLAIDWGLDGQEPVLSEKDLNAPAWRDWTSPF